MFRTFTSSEVRKKARWLLAGLITLLLAVNGLNVLNSYVGRDFMSAIAARNMPEFIRNAVFYVGVFAASTLVAVILRFSEERLGLLWREWLTRHLANSYLDARTYHHLHVSGKVTNPDQRISEDVRAFTSTTLSFALMSLNAAFTIVAFFGVLWTISFHLLCVAVGYAIIGSSLTIFLGRRLVGLNYKQFDKEADFRADLLHIRENADAIALMHNEENLQKRLMKLIDEWGANFRQIIAVNRNLGFFTTGYNYLIQIIPVLVVAPLFIKGKVEFGVVTQSAMAFSALTGAFSLVVSQFLSISSYASVIARLSELTESFDEDRHKQASPIHTMNSPEFIAFHHLTLHSPDDGADLIRDLTVSIPWGMRLLVKGENSGAKEMLFRALDGLCDSGEGQIERPDATNLLFLAEQPYRARSTLRDLVTPPKKQVSDEEIHDALHILGGEAIVTKACGLDCEQPWEDVLSPEDEQLLGVARLLLARPKFAVSQRFGSSFDVTRRQRVMRLLTERSISYVNIGNDEESLGSYDALLELSRSGAWKWTVLHPPQPSDASN